MNKKKPKLSYFKPFRCKCFVLNNEKNDIGKFDLRSDDGVFVGYLSNKKILQNLQQNKLMYGGECTCCV